MLTPRWRPCANALLADLPEQDRTAEQEARALMADLLEWHRRDAKPGWWRFFHLHDLTDDELLGEPDAIAGLRLEGIIGQVKRRTLCAIVFPPQEHPFRQGDLAVDPRSGKQWTIHQIDNAAGTLDLRRGRNNMNPDPVVLVERGPIKTDNHRARLRDLAAKVAKLGEAEWGRGAELDLLLRRRPQGLGNAPDASLRLPGEEAVDAGRRLALALIDSQLPIQGPPGSGKTYTARSRSVISLPLGEGWA